MFRSEALRKQAVEELRAAQARRRLSEEERALELLRIRQRLLRVHTGGEALELLVNSRAVHAALRERLAFPQFYDERFVLRQWVDIAPELVCSSVHARVRVRLTAACRNSAGLSSPAAACTPSRSYTRSSISRTPHAGARRPISSCVASGTRHNLSSILMHARSLFA